MVKDPNVRVQEASALLSSKFRETWSIRQTFLRFRDSDVQLPVNKSRDRKNAIVFKLPQLSFVSSVLHNPFYAGVYTYGRRPCETLLKDGRLVKRQGKEVRAEECRVFIRDHHEGYIGWRTYEENQSRMRHNRHGFEVDESIASIRSGQGQVGS